MKKNKCISAFIAASMFFLSFFSGCGSKNEAGIIKTEKENKPPVSTAVSSNEIPAVKYNNITETGNQTAPETTTGKEAETETVTEKPEKSGDITAVESEDFFDGAVFIGDSVTMGLRNYVTSERNKGHKCLDNAVFLTAGSMGYANTVQKIGAADAIHPRYKGKEMYIEDALALIKAKKVFIMLGMNDFCIYSVKEGIANTEKCINRIKEKNPETDIYIESVTPVNRDKGKFNNENIDKFNAALKKFCVENGCTYVNVASVMKNSNGTLVDSYCSDPDGKGVHITKEGCKVWVDYLNKLFVEEK